MKILKDKRLQNLPLAPSILLLIVSLGLLLGYFLYSGPEFSYDDAMYLSMAHGLLSHTYNPADGAFSGTFLTVSMLALSFQLFGTNLFAASFPDTFSYVVMIIAIFLTGKKIKDESFGLFSAFVAATTPFIVVYVTRAMPDLILGMFLSLSMCFLVSNRGSNKKKSLSFLSGLFAGLTSSVKSEGLAIFMIFILYVLFLCVSGRENKKKNGTNFYELNLPLAFFGLLVGVSLYFLIPFLYTGDFLSGLFSFSTSSIPSTFGDNVNNLIDLLNPYRLQNGLTTVVGDQIFPLGLLFDISLISSAILLIRKDNKIFIFALTNLFVVLYLSFGSTSISQYTLHMQLSRYLILISLPFSIVAAYALFSVYNLLMKFGRYIALLVVLLILVVNFILYAPVFSTLQTTNSIFKFATLQYLSDVSYLHTFNSSPLNIYVVGSEPFLQSNILSFLMAYDSNVSFSAPQTCYAGGKNGFLLISGFSYSKVNITTWLSDNCTSVLLENFTERGSSAVNLLYRLSFIR